MKGEDREFLELLGYLYLQYGKADEARIIYAVLVELSAPQPLLTLAYAYCLSQTGQYAVALHHLDSLERAPFSLKERSAYLLLRGNVLWHLGKSQDSRQIFRQFLTVERQRARFNPTRLSLIVRSATEKAREARGALEALRSVQTPATAPTVAGKVTVAQSPGAPRTDGFVRRILRFIARKELHRELGGSD
ncbi:MAG: hypothetical protein LBT98_00740 [Puniceicoccales bacterium]|nr:hypothetical protein [Puniceicoccales bacterium]